MIFPSRWRTYGLLVAVVVAVIAVGLAIPEAIGHPDSAATLTPAPASQPARVVNHDTRPPAPYSALGLVTSPPPPPGTVLTASDVGVTPISITIGVILLGLGGLSAFGVDTSSLDPAVQRTYWDAAIGRVNAAGGLDGRRLEAVYATADILSTDSMRAACRVLTEDHRVFAVANVLGVTGDPILCVTEDHATPYLAISGADASYYTLSAGRLVTLEPSTQRTLALVVSTLSTMLRGHRVGVLHDTGPGGIDGASFARSLRAAGASSVVDAPLSGDDPLVVSGEVADAERRMQAANVDTVLLLTNAVYGSVFATQADQGIYTPTYVMSDLGFATAGDSYLSNMPPAFFRRAVAVTTTDVGQGRAGLPERPLDAGCRTAFEKASGKTVQRDSGDDIAALASCALVQILTMGVTGAGPNPTRAGFVAALDRLGPFGLPGFGRALLTATRHDAADDVGVIDAHGDCQCFYAIDGFRPA